MKNKFRRHILIGGLMIVTGLSALRAQRSVTEISDIRTMASPAAWKEIGDGRLTGWKGIRTIKEGGILSLPDSAVYRIPDGPKGWYRKGLLKEYDGVEDARQWYGIRFDIQLQDDRPFYATILLEKPPTAGPRLEMIRSASARLSLKGKGWQTVTVPFSSFDFDTGFMMFLKYLKQVSITGTYADVVESSTAGGSVREGIDEKAAAGARPRRTDRKAGSGSLNGHSFILLRNIKFIRGNPIHLQSDIQSKPADARSVATYSIQVGNSSEQVQMVNLRLQKAGWEGMKATVDPESVLLSPGETKEVKVKVTVPATAPPGAQETQTLWATPVNGAAAEKMEFTTIRRLPSPYLVLTEEGWKDVKEKTEKYDWAKKSLDNMIRIADGWQVPEVPRGGIKTDVGTNGLFKSYIERELWPTAIAYKMTGERKYGDKLVSWLLRFSDPENGYPVTLHAAGNDIPQEGGVIEGGVRAYDLIRDKGLLTPQQQEQIEASFRLFIDVVKDMLQGDGAISNWSVFNLGPAAQCALEIQDLQRFNDILYGPTGLIDQLRYGTMDDGWWYEVSLGYNIGAAANMTSVALAAKPFGIDLIHAQFPVSLTSNTGIRPYELEKHQGIDFTKFGPVKDNYVSIKKMWDGIIIYPDYRGIMFGMSDGHEEKVGGAVFEQAYYAFRDTAYIPLFRQSKERSLVYGLPEFPDTKSRPSSVSGYAANAGVAVLRSQTAGRQPAEQIQGAFKWGTHGGFHGHYDRINFLSLMRYGRSFWNPETSWYGYASYMYKWWVQTSLPHNMVVVDGKMQEPKESNLLLFHSGDMLQAVAAETKARWSNPPYMGGYDQVAAIKNGDQPYVPIYDGHPKPTVVTGYTEPVLQRRLMLVLDDYVVLADYLKAEKTHVFDNLLHLRGAVVEGNFPFIGHAAQWDTSALSSGQFITNVNKYQVDGTAKITSVNRYAPLGSDGKNREMNNWETGASNHFFNEPGILNMDIYGVWPQKKELLLADYAESWPVSKKLEYTLRVDGYLVDSGRIGTWILGKAVFDVDVSHKKTVQLTIKTNRSARTLKTILVAGAVVVDAKGKEIHLTADRVKNTNIAPLSSKGKDYAGGPVKIAGDPYTDFLAAEPASIDDNGVITLDLTGLNAVRFKAILGGDWPVGDEEQLRKVVDIRVTGQEASFLTVIEPFEDKKLIKKVTALSANELVVELNDGRVQKISIEHLADMEGKVLVKVSEEVNGKAIRKEEATGVVDK